MNLLLFSDLHGSRGHADDLVKKADEADVVIGAGDFGNLRRGIRQCVEWLAPINKPSVLVPGNSESFEELRDACEVCWPSATVLHGSGTEIEGIPFFGIGGGIPVTPFGSWSYDFTENQARDLLIGCPEGAVLISHSPPKGILDVSSRGQSLGSVAVREVIDQKTPRLVVCGHIHESGGKQEVLGETTVINAGPAGVMFQI